MFEIQTVEDIVNEYSRLSEVESILMAGSRTVNTEDSSSDIDLYIYSTREVPVTKRQKIASAFSDNFQIDLKIWESSDEWYLRDSKVMVDIIYRSFNWLDEQLESTLFSHIASTGYTTCFWHNLLTSVILFDRNNKAKVLKEKYDICYPKELKYNIVAKNYPALKECFSSYYEQIEKSIRRGDFISTNHRIAEFLSSYFDIIFAVNELPHPGEKKLVKIVKNTCKKVPANFEEDLYNVFKNISSNDVSILKYLDVLIKNLDSFLNKENLLSLR
ncbi:MAG: DUF4037 domain-containing protein [Clostridia bacterium]|nr:DUF4037 domain-containing protein [Clostridia bacterium]